MDDWTEREGMLDRLTDVVPTGAKRADVPRAGEGDSDPHQERLL